MPEQLALIEIEAEVKLTDRQALALDDVRRAGPDGIDADQIGANWCAEKGIHSADNRCAYDGKSGRQVLESLAAKGLVTYRRSNRAKSFPGGWVIAGTSSVPTGTGPACVGMLEPSEAIPF